MATPKSLLELYKEMKKDRRDYSDRQWETIKFFSYIFIALLTAYITLIKFVGDSDFGKVIMISIAILIPMFVFSGIGLHNFKRESSRLFEKIAIIMKIEEGLDFFDKRDNKKKNSQNNNYKVLKCDDYYLSDKMVELDPKIKSTNDFKNMMMKQKTLTSDYGNVYSCFKWVFYMYMAMPIVLVIMAIFLFK